MNIKNNNIKNIIQLNHKDKNIRKLIRLSIPIMLSNFLQSAYSLTDLFWLGKLGSYAVASITLSMPIIMFLNSFGMGLSIAGNIFVSQYKGRKDQKNIDHYASQTLSIIILFSLIICAFGLISNKYIIKSMNVSNEIGLNAIQYLNIMFISTIFIFGFFTIQALFRAVDNPKLPLFFVSFGVILNFIIDPFFIHKFKVLGAGIATLITMGIVFISMFIILLNGKKGIKIKLKDMIPNKDSFKRIFSLGLPASFQFSLRSLSMFALMYVVAKFGKVVIAAFGITNQIISLVMLFIIGLAQANSIIVGHFMGLRKTKEAREITIKSTKLTIFLTILLGLFIFLLSKNIVIIFIKDKSVIQLTTSFLRIVSFGFVFAGIQNILNSCFKGSGNTKISLIITIISIWLIRIPLAYSLSLIYNEIGIIFALVLSNIIGSLISIFVFKRDFWEKKRII